MLQIIFNYKHNFFFICILSNMITVKFYFVVKIQWTPFWKHRNSKEIYASWEVTPVLIFIFSNVMHILWLGLVVPKIYMFFAKHRKGGYYITAFKCSLTCVCVCVCVWHHGANEKIRNKIHKIPAFSVIALGIIWIVAYSTLYEYLYEYLYLYECLPTVLYCAIYKSETGGFKITSLKTLYLCR